MSHKKIDHYIRFAETDFFLDETFQHWVLTGDPGSEALFQELISLHPEKAVEIDRAKTKLRSLKINNWKTISPKRIATSFEEIKLRLDQTEVARIWPKLYWKWLATAASVVLISAYGIYWYGFKPRTISTSYGQSQAIYLAEGSAVILGSNSSIDISGRWNFLSERKLYLKGEAYFEVKRKHQANAETSEFQDFDVLTDQLDIKVIGTRFHVTSRHEQTNVLLDEGKVNLTENKNPSNTLLMRPGQLAESNKKSAGIHLLDATTASSFTSWKTNKLICREISLTQLSQRFEDVFGNELVFTGGAWTNEMFTGSLPINDFSRCIEILSASFDCVPLIKNDQIEFKRETPD